MKKTLLVSLAMLFSFAGKAQSIPEAPLKVEFANVQILLNSDSRQKVNAEIQRLLTPQNSYLDQKLERMQLYFPIIEKILEAENVPDDFKYLCVLESDLNPNAVSATNAVGFWQFKDFTAKEMGLIMSKNQDDRKNLQLSTIAAAQYLKKNNLVFKNWVSTALSYTIGAGGAAEIVPVDWSFANEIKFENSPHPYLIKSLAHKLAYQHRLSRIGQSQNTLVEYPAKGKSISDIASEIGLPDSELKKYNSWITSNQIPTDKDYIVLVHTNKSNAPFISNRATDMVKTDFIAVGYPKLKRITMVVTSTDQPVFYEINDKRGILAQPGDEVAQLAKKGKVSISKILSYNDMSDRDLAKEGTVYYLQKKYKKGDIPYHTLAEKQSLWDVAHMYGIRLKNLKKYNRILEGETLIPGRVLWLQKKRPKKQEIQYNKTLVAPPEVLTTEPKIAELEVPRTETNTLASGRKRIHRVLENETLFSLANKYGTTVEELRKLNNIKPNEGIQYNQRLIIPDSDEPEDDWVEDEPVLMPEKKPTVANVEKPVKPIADNPSLGNIPVTTTGETTTHQVKPGETLFAIANRYNMTVTELRQLNNMSPAQTLKSGQRLLVAKSSGTAAQLAEKKAVASPVVNAVSPSATSHIVSKGETLFSIANRYGMEVDDLRRLNGISGNNIMSGQRLKLSGTANNTETRTATQYYTVKPGETLFSIANKHGVTVNDLKNWNNMGSNKLVSGKRIIVKK